MEKFKEVVFRVHVTDDTAVEALRKALSINSKFWGDPYVSKNIMLQDALHHAYNFITMEEDKQAFLLKHNTMKHVAKKPRQHSAYCKSNKEKSNIYYVSEDGQVSKIDSAGLVIGPRIYQY